MVVAWTHETWSRILPTSYTATTIQSSQLHGTTAHSQTSRAWIFISVTFYGNNIGLILHLFKQLKATGDWISLPLQSDPELSKNLDLWSPHAIFLQLTGSSSVKERSGFDPDFRKKLRSHQFVYKMAASMW